MVETSEILIPQEAKSRIDNFIDNKVYEVEGKRIQVVAKESSSSKEKPSQDGAVIFIPGWSAGTAKTLEFLTQRFGEDSGRRSFAITTRPEQVISDSLYQEAKAIEQFVKEKGLKKVILVGHSEGGVKAINLVDILQVKDPDVAIEGLILLDPVGLYEMGRGELAGKFALDSMVKTPPSLIREAIRSRSLASILKGIQASTDIIFNIAREVVASKGIGYPQRLWRQIGEMVRKNTRLDKIKCPVVLIQGAEDIVSSPKRVVPSDEIRSLWSTRRKFLKEVFFPNAADVSMLTPSRLGHHGLPHFRSEQISKVALYLLNRLYRPKESIGSNSPLESV